MKQEQQKTWLDLREEEYKEGEKREEKLVNSLAKLGIRVEGAQEEQKYWEKYITWLRQSEEKAGVAPATVRMCEQIKEEAVENEKEATEAVGKIKSELERIRCLGAFVRWVSQRT